MICVAPFSELNDADSAAFRADSSPFNYAAGYRNGYVVRLDDFEHHERHNGTWRQYAPAGVSDGLVAWYWARDFIARPDGYALRQWRDWSGDENNLVAPDGNEAFVGTVGDQRLSDGAAGTSKLDATLPIAGQAVSFVTRIKTRSVGNFVRPISLSNDFVVNSLIPILVYTTLMRVRIYSDEALVTLEALGLSADTIYTVSLVRDGAFASLYVDGVQADSTSAIGATQACTNLTLHSRPDLEDQQGGAISQLAIYDRAISDLEREAIEAWMARPTRTIGGC